MKVPLSWLKEYVDIGLSAKEVAHLLTMAGTEVAGIETIGDWGPCYIGLVRKIEPHPNADRLTLCTVDIGLEQLQVVCGAPNVSEGLKVPLAKVGAYIFNVHSRKHETLKQAQIRGVISQGMICSELELGLGQDHTGILALSGDAPVGKPLADYLGDQVLDLDVTPNRGDCLSMLGIAHEVAALTGAQVREPDASYPEVGEPVESITSVHLVDPNLCHRYTASLVSGIHVGPSPKWLQDRLLKVGMRPINNVVDVTNYVMLEYNQPLHAFDFDTLNERRIVVRRAKPGEVLTSLDGTERTLGPDMLIIADAKYAVGLAGVIGGANSEISSGTTTVLLESATFDPTNNRNTALALRIRTEATIRFEKGLRSELAPIALRRATQLIMETAGGVAAQGIIDIRPETDTGPSSVNLTESGMAKLLGIRFSRKQVEQVLTSLGFECKRVNGDNLRVTIPYWRSDISCENDLIEECARIIGYDQIPTTMLSTPIPHHKPQPHQVLREQIKDALASEGLQEVISYPLTDIESLNKASNPFDSPTALRLANPLNVRQQYLRTHLRASLLYTLASNQFILPSPLGLFEIGRVYLPRQDALPEEREMVVGTLMGPRCEPSWLDKDVFQVGFYDAKGIIDRLLSNLGISATYKLANDSPFAVGKGAIILDGNETIGIIGELHPTVLDSFGLNSSPAVMFELDLNKVLVAKGDAVRRYATLGRFPMAIRDLAIVVGLDIPAARVQQIMLNNPLAVQISLFDVYNGGNVPDGKRSLAYHIEFQAPDHTLTTKETNDALRAVLLSLEMEVGAVLRSSLLPSQEGIA
jgi:phenylalanyl-tRNA synthetase beta chain